MAAVNDGDPSQNSSPPAPDTIIPSASISYPSTRGPSGVAQIPVDTGRFSPRGKRTAIFFIALGLLTFFLPVIEFDPPERGRQYWSVLEVAERPPAEPKKGSATAGVFDVKGLFASAALIPFEFVYVFYTILLAALAAVLLLPFRKLLVGIGVAGLICLVLPFQRTTGLMRVAASNSFLSSRGGDLQMVWIAFAIEFAILAIVGWTDANT
jgi:hypothetical protein